MEFVSNDVLKSLLPILQKNCETDNFEQNSFKIANI